MYEGHRVKYPLFLLGLEKLEFSRYSNNSQTSKFMKIRPVIAELPHSDGRTDGRRQRHGKANSHLLQFYERD